MAGLTSPASDTRNPDLPEIAGRKIILFGSVPNGQQIVAKIKRNNVFIINSIADLNDHVSVEYNPDSDKTKAINSIIILACSGDDVSAVADIHKVALGINVLVTTIVIYNSCCMPISNFKSLSDLRASSDMVIITSDVNYLEYMLDCLV